MRTTRMMLLGTLATLAVLPAAEPNAREIILRAFEVDEANQKLARNYTFHDRTEERTLDRKGQLKSTKSKTYDVTLLEGSIYRRLIARDDEPLGVDDEKREQRKLDKSIAKMQKETAGKRAKRLAKQEKRKQEEREFVAEIADAYDFRVAGEEQLAGVDTYVITAEPKPGYRPRRRRARFLTKLRGTLWIAKQDYGWVRVEAQTIDKIAFGLFLFRLNKGAEMQLQQTRVNDEVWLLEAFRVRFKARVGLVKGFHQEILSTHNNYRKFSTDSRIVSVEPVE